MPATFEHSVLVPRGANPGLHNAAAEGLDAGGNQCFPVAMQRICVDCRGDRAAESTRQVRILGFPQRERRAHRASQPRAHPSAFSSQRQEPRWARLQSVPRAPCPSHLHVQAQAIAAHACAASPPHRTRRQRCEPAVRCDEYGLACAQDFDLLRQPSPRLFVPPRASGQSCGSRHP